MSPAAESGRMRLFALVNQLSEAYLTARGAVLVDLPMLTRMISSPGALNGMIPTDVPPFEVDFFDFNMFLTQSSQLYLEAALAISNLDQVYCSMKSFRRERADFRHLPEFHHIEYEANIGFEENIDVQKAYLNFLLEGLVERGNAELRSYIAPAEIEALGRLSENDRVVQLSLEEAMKLLYEDTGHQRHRVRPLTCMHFSAWEEIRLTELLGNRIVFVTYFPSDEVAFYHENSPHRPELAVNADLLFPGYGEIIGSGERVRTHADTAAKADRFLLSRADYEYYISTRKLSGEQLHSGWGMGVERLLQAVTKTPFIELTKPFPRVHRSQYP